MKNEKKEIFLKDYTPPVFFIDTIDLRFELDEKKTRVTSTLLCRKNTTYEQAILQLNGEYTELEQVKLNDVVLDSSQYTLEQGLLTITDATSDCSVEITSVFDPSANKALEGLYLSSGNFCTQCEPEGFRRITYFPDRPDVMSVFTVTIVGDKEKYPVLLSNGNLKESGMMEDNKHYAVWHDPFKKPSYLFALVAGDLSCVKDSYITSSGRDVALEIYVEHQNKNKCTHAMKSLKRSMQWDEEKFGREYDLETYMIVAVDDFNMGAMENKGLNVFNSKYVLATPETATDADYDGIQGVIGHEYFHNWTGNRITCRDWFQLSLKEGLTVFRDQEFSSDMGSRAVKRISDVNIMRSFQFKEDSGPMAHPVRPPSFVEINNFYTLTVYNKGAEVIRMLHTFLGASGFRKGMDCYFERHDGQAVTCDDFIAAMEDANDVDFSLFKRWYSQAGTPTLNVDEEYDEENRQYTLLIEQSCPATPETKEKLPFTIPVKIGLLSPSGDMIRPEPASGEQPDEHGTVVVELQDETNKIVFNNLENKPVVSFLRDFSAPVKVTLKRPDRELALLMAHDPDPFTRWDASQELALKAILTQIELFQQNKHLGIDDLLLDALEKVFKDISSDPALRAMTVTLPSENWISQQLPVIDPVAVFSVRQFFRKKIQKQLQETLQEIYFQLHSDEPYTYNPLETAKRMLKNCCLQYLLAGTDLSEAAIDLGLSQYHACDNMTDRIAALQAIVNCSEEKGNELLEDFYRAWNHDPLVMDKWLSIQAGCSLPGTLDRVKRLLQHPVFTMSNPNKVRSLIGVFCSTNHAQFHALDGQGYTFLTECVTELDSFNPLIASRLLTPLTGWKKYDEKRQQLMREHLVILAEKKDLSEDVNEVVQRSL